MNFKIPLSIVNCQLSTINYQLSTVNYQLSTINCQLSTINYQLSTILTSLHLFLRKSYNDQYSIEKLFSGIVPHLEAKTDYDVKLFSMPYESKGIINRAKNLWFTYKNQGDINHVTGDIHFIVFALPRDKTILTIHDCGTVLRLRGLKLLFFTLLWLRWPAKWVKYITVISEKTKSDLVDIIKIDPKKITVIPNYIHPGFEPSLLSESPVFNILHIGTARHKNWTRLAQAVYGINCQVTIIGRLSPKELRFLDEEGVRYIHKQDLTEEQLKDEYRNAHIVYFASTFEGFGMPILEAQAMAKPVITSDISPMNYVAGDKVIYVNPFDTGQIHNKILNTHMNPGEQQSYILAGLQNVKRFSIGEVVRQYMLLYKMV